MTAEHKYEMTISLQIVEHLGLNLYSNTSAVISEAVANAWDADAKTVEITLEKDCITIKDDGCGMDTDDINNKYLTVGYQKRHLVPITPMLNRKVMGRKGIGKLSLLSIAETILICKSFFSKVLKFLAFQGVWIFLCSQFPLFFPLSGKNKGKSYCTLSSSFAASRLASLLACA